MRKRERDKERECKINLYKCLIVSLNCLSSCLCLWDLDSSHVRLQGAVMSIPNVAAVAAAVAAHII